MEKKSDQALAIVLLALLQDFLASDAVEVKPSVNPAVVGGTVTFSLSPSTTLKGGSWALGDTLILTWSGDQQAVFPSHSGRASVNVTTGALSLSSLKLADSGVYVLQSTDPVLKASASVTVVEPVSNVTLSVNQTDLTELKSSALIKCSVSSGSLLSFLWMNGSVAITASSRVQITDGNSTLSISNLTRYDSGPFSCHVSNPISNGTSDPVNFTISYGPDNMALTVNGLSETSFPVGSNLTMLCLAKSSPPAQLQWAFKGKLMNTTGTMLEMLHVRQDQSGQYSCLAFNNRTNVRNSITKDIIISKSEQQVMNVLLLLLSLTGFLLSLPN